MRDIWQKKIFYCYCSIFYDNLDGMLTIVHGVRRYCFDLVDHIRYSQNHGDDLSSQVVEATRSEQESALFCCMDYEV